MLSLKNTKRVHLVKVEPDYIHAGFRLFEALFPYSSSFYWPISIVIVDILWGVVLCSVVATVSFCIGKWLL